MDSAHVIKIDIRTVLEEIGRGPQGSTPPDALAVGNIWCKTVVAAMLLL
jgi:hypothetical protein